MTKTPLSKELFFSKTNDYLNIYLPCQAHKSPRTIKTYRDGLSVFRRYIWNEKRISINKFRFDNCTYDFLLNYLSYLKNSGNKATTCNNRMASIKSYLWYVADGDISMQGIALAASKIPRIKEPKINRPVIQDDDFSPFYLHRWILKSAYETKPLWFCFMIQRFVYQSLWSCS